MNNMNPKPSSNGYKVEAMKNTKTSKIDENREKNHQQRYEFCKVCKLNNDQGRCHVYYPKHQKALSLFLSRFRSKLVNEVFFFLKNPFLLRPEHDSLNRLWCVFCDFDNVECGSSFACENAIAHLASLEHMKQVKGFLWKHGGVVECANSFCISEADLAKWEKKCKSLKAEVAVEASGKSLRQSLNNIHTKTNSDCINSFNKNDHSLSIAFNFSNGVIPLQNPTNERSQVLSIYGVTENGCQSHDHASIATGTNTATPNTLSGSFGHQNCNHSFPMDPRSYNCSVNGKVVPHETIGISEGVFHGTSSGQTSSQGLLSLAQISSSEQENGGNVHSGAPPPWFNDTEANELPREQKPGLGNAVTSQVRPLKSSKLNPKRVGAAWAERRKIELELEKRGEMSKQVDADWLPNFGRVWQSGCRKESRKEFQVENKVSGKVENQVENPVLLKPYISKRMRGFQDNETQLTTSSYGCK